MSDSAVKALNDSATAWRRRGTPEWTAAAELIELAADTLAGYDRLLNAPEILDFVKAVQLEAAHQRQRWPSEHDAGKTDADWFWLIGYLAGKALHNPPKQGAMLGALQLHRIITVAAAACNWHAARLGKTNMRPGIAPPADEDAA